MGKEKLYAWMKGKASLRFISLCFREGEGSTAAEAGEVKSRLEAERRGMFPRVRSATRILGIFAVIVFFCLHTAANGQTVSSNTEETKRAKHFFEDNVLTKCGSSYYDAGSDLDQAISAEEKEFLTEYSRVVFHGDPLEVSYADRKNGIEQKQTALMLPSAWRERDLRRHTWKEWIGPSDSSSGLGALRALGQGPLHFGGFGMMGVELWKVHGRWLYIIPPVIDPSQQLHPVDEITHKTVSCDGSLQVSKVVPKSLLTPPPLLGPEKDRLYEGSADGFVAALPKFIQRAAVARGVNPHNYEKEEASIIDVVRTCAQITPQMASSVTEENGQENLDKIGNGQYAVCYSSRWRMEHGQGQFIPVSDKVKKWNKETERGIVLWLKVNGPRGWRDGEGFTLDVLFTGLKSDDAEGDSMAATLADNYSIVNATIRGPQPITDGGLYGVVHTPWKHTSVGPRGVVLRMFPDSSSKADFSIPGGTAVIINGESRDGWQHVIGTSNNFYGWARSEFFVDGESNPAARSPHSYAVTKDNPALGGPVDLSFYKDMKQVNQKASVGPKGLELRHYPSLARSVTATLPANTSVVIDMEIQNGWMHIATQDYSVRGWVPPGSFSEPYNRGNAGS